jgi:uncharacterized protein YggE
VTVPTLFVTGSAEREVTPDLVVVSVSVQTPVMPTPQAALSAAADARRRLLGHLEAGLAGVAISDGRVTTRQEQRQIRAERPGGTETRWEVAGSTGLCLITIQAGAARAAEIVAAAGAHPDAERVSPAFEVSAALERSTRDDLERDAVRDALARAEGLAAAAGMAVGRVVSIGEHAPASPQPPGVEHMRYSQPLADMSPDELEEALGEPRPEPEPRAAEVPVRLELREAGGGGPPA